MEEDTFSPFQHIYTKSKQAQFWFKFLTPWQPMRQFKFKIGENVNNDTITFQVQIETRSFSSKERPF